MSVLYVYYYISIVHVIEDRSTELTRVLLLSLSEQGREDVAIDWPLRDVLFAGTVRPVLAPLQAPLSSHARRSESSFQPPTAQRPAALVHHQPIWNKLNG